MVDFFLFHFFFFFFFCKEDYFICKFMAISIKEGAIIVLIRKHNT